MLEHNNVCFRRSDFMDGPLYAFPLHTNNLTELDWTPPLRDNNVLWVNEGPTDYTKLCQETN